MLEQDLEKYLVREVEAIGGIAEKTISPSGRGYFDRVIVLPGGRVVFAEVKKPKGSRVSPHQMWRHKRYKSLGVEVAVIKTVDDVDRLLRAP